MQFTNGDGGASHSMKHDGEQVQRFNQESVIFEFTSYFFFLMKKCQNSVIIYKMA